MRIRVFAIAAWQAGDLLLAYISVSVSAATAGFFRFNFLPARSFLGDVGAVPVGFLAAAIGLEGWMNGVWPGWFPLMVFSPFIIDATIALFKRVFRGARFWKAQRNHYYQRLVRMGWSHRRLALAEYALMLCVGVSALLSLDFTPGQQTMSVAVWLIIYLTLIVKIDRRWRLMAVDEGRR